MRKSILYLSLLALLSTLGCLDTFTFENLDQDTSIVIDGQLQSNDGPHTLRISRVLKFGDKFFDPVQGVRVSLSHNDTFYDYVEVSPGVHIISQGVVSPKEGDVCYVEMTLPNGDIVKSAPDMMPGSHDLEAANVVFKRESTTDQFGIKRRQRIIEISVTSEYPEIEQGEEFFLRFGIQEDYSYPEVFCGGLHQPKSCYVNIPAFSKDFTLFNSSLSSRSRVDSLLLFKKQDLTSTEFRGRHYFSVFQYTITESAYDYWLRVKEVTNQSGTVFDKPPAAVIGNLTNATDPSVPVLGYFELASVSIARDFVLPFEYFADAPDQDRCGPFLRRSWPGSCCNCLEIPDATTLRPAWF